MHSRVVITYIYYSVMIVGVEENILQYNSVHNITVSHWPISDQNGTTAKQNRY